MITSTFHVSDMHCASCENRISDALLSIPGILSVRANPVRRELFVEHDQEAAPVLDVFSRIEALGFSPMLESGSDTLAQRRDIKRLGVAAIGMMQVVMQALALYIGDSQGMAYEHVRLLQFASFVFTLPVIAYSAQPFFHNAWSSLTGIRHPRQLLTGLSMDVPVSLALIIAFSASTLTLARGHGEVYFDSVVMFTFLLLTARLIDKGLSRRSKGVSAMSLLPDRCTVVRDGNDSQIDTSELVIGDRVLVRPGERVVADGVIARGTAHLDESLLTGEADVVVRETGEPVTAGTTNSFQSFEFTVEQLNRASRLARIEELAATAMSQRPQSVSRANQIAGYFVFGMLVFACATALYWLITDSTQALGATIAVLVVSCPCALALATPAAITAALARLQSCGVVVSSGDILETAADIRGVALDKTGTLTTGDIRIERFEQLASWNEESCRRFAAGLERASNHPVARAFHGADATPMREVRIDPYGVVGHCDAGEVRIGTRAYCLGADSGHSNADESGRAIWLSVDRKAAARFRLAEQVRADVDVTLAAFRKVGVELVLLSGDTSANCHSFADRLPVFAGLTPEDKRRHLMTYRQKTGPVMMLGDGINDLPALAEADISAVVLEAPDSVKSVSNVLLLSRQLRPIYQLIGTARRSRRVIRQNMTWALLYNVTMIPLAASGHLVPWMAALGMSLSSLLVVMNSARLQARRN